MEKMERMQASAAPEIILSAEQKPETAKLLASHKHDLIIKPWMPKKGEQVLCIYEPVRNGRGYVLGGIQQWQ